jgi:CheY-like chemotaxis protein
MTPKKILVVEDDKFVQKCISGILTAAGYKVLTAEDPSATLRLIRTEHPDLITLDIDLSRGAPSDSWDGFTIVDWLQRLNDGNQPAVIVMISGSDPAALAAKIKAARIFAFLRKPVLKEPLLEMVARGLAAGAPLVEPEGPPPA